MFLHYWKYFLLDGYTESLRIIIYFVITLLGIWSSLASFHAALIT